MVTSLFFQFPLFFFNDTATTEIYTLSLHDALPIYLRSFTGAPRSSILTLRDSEPVACDKIIHLAQSAHPTPAVPDRKSTRLNSSHSQISYAVFCLKKKKTHTELYHSKYWVMTRRSH